MPPTKMSGFANSEEMKELLKNALVISLWKNDLSAPDIQICEQS